MSGSSSSSIVTSLLEVHSAAALPVNALASLPPGELHRRGAREWRGGGKVVGGLRWADGGSQLFWRECRWPGLR